VAWGQLPGFAPLRKSAIATAFESQRAEAAWTSAALAAHGYEPEQTPGEIRLHNCPFHALVGEHKALVCGMNLALIDGVVEGLDLTGVKPVLDPKPGMCCVALRLGVK
jgi:predicted ArsR family transcriptional regulator